MVQIEIHNAISKVITPDPGIRKAVSDCLSYQLPGSQFAMASRPGWDGRIRLLKANGTFPTGLIPRLRELLSGLDVPFDISDLRTRSKDSIAITLNESFEPRDYQIEACELTDTEPRGVYVVGTGGGKSATAAMIIARRSVPTLFVTPDTGLREQLAGVFRGLNIDVSTDVKSGNVVVSNIQALVKKDPKLFERFGMLMIDEMHHSSAKSYLTINALCKNAYYRYGFTGTFMRPDGTDMAMHGVLSEVIFKRSTSELIELGWLVRPYITISRYEVKGWSRLNYKDAYNTIVSDLGFNTLIAEIAEKKISEGLQTLVLVRRKGHGELLNRMIDGSHYLSGDDSIEHRKIIVQRFTNREIPCIIATSIFGEGTDIPSIDVLINARCEKSNVQTNQGAGRALRKIPGKERCEIFDFLIIGQKHLRAHSVERIKAYRREPAFRISIRR